MSIDDTWRQIAAAAAQQPGALNISPAVAGWMGRIAAAQGAPAPTPDDASAAPAPAPQAAAPAPAPAPATMPAGAMPNLHPVRNAILGLLAGGPLGMFQQIQQNDQQKVAMARMQQVYSSLPDEYKPLFAADPQGFLAAYMKNAVEGQKLAEGEELVFAGGRKVQNVKRGVDKESGRPYYLTDDGPVVGDSLGGDIKAENGLITSGRLGVLGTYSTPQKLAMGESAAAFTPTVTGVGPGAGAAPAGPMPAAAVAAAAGAARAAPKGDIADMIRQRAAAAGLDDAGQANMVRFGQLESSLNPKARNGASIGLFQFRAPTFAQLGGKNIDDPQEQTDKAIQLYKQNTAALEAAGIPVTPTSLYLSHQQGMVGARALYEAAPGTSAVQALAPVYQAHYGPKRGLDIARQAIVRNGGSADMSAQDFIAKWDAKVGAQPAAGPATAPAAMEAGAPASASAGSPAPGWSMGAPAGMPGLPANVSNLSGEDLIKALPPMVANQVKALADGRVPAQGFALSKPYWQQVMQLAEQYEPGFDASVFQQRVQARKAVAPGGNVSNNLVALSTAQQHIGKLWKAIGDLQNAGLPMLDAVGNWASAQAGQPNVTNFQTVRDAVTDELERALRGSGGSAGQIMEWRSRLKDSNSPEQLYGTAREMSDLLAARMGEALRPYNETMGANVQPQDKMTPAAKEAYDMIHSGTDWASWQQAKKTSGGPTAPSAPGKGGGELQTLTPAQAAKLPSGTPFRTTDGRVLVRH